MRWFIVAIFGHCFILFILLMPSASCAAIQGERSQSLALPGSSIATMTPVLVVVLYVVGEMLHRAKHRATRWVQLLVVPAMLYPAFIYWMFSYTIVTLGTISSGEIHRFKKEFSVPVVFESEAGSFQATVASKAYDPRMVEWLHSIAATPPRQSH